MPVLTRRAFTTTALSALAAPAFAQQLDKISFGTNWVAEAEHGGFYQAVADGTYKKYGLDVTIVPGGPQVNNRMLLLAGRIDFFMSANCLQSFDAAVNNRMLLLAGRIDFFMSANCLQPSTPSRRTSQWSRSRPSSRRTRRCCSRIRARRRRSRI